MKLINLPPNFTLTHFSILWGQFVNWWSVNSWWTSMWSTKPNLLWTVLNIMQGSNYKDQWIFVSWIWWKIATNSHWLGWYLLLVSNHLLLVANYLLLVSNYLLLVANYLLLVVNYILLVANHLLLVTNHFLPVANHLLFAVLLWSWWKMLTPKFLTSNLFLTKEKNILQNLSMSISASHTR